MKKLLITFFIILVSLPTFAKPGTIVTYTIDPEKNALEHNNRGIMYLEERCYYAAIQEFKIAISLNPKAQSTSVYMNNLGKVYLIIGYPELALTCFEDAIKQYSLNFEYYNNLAKCYNQLGKTNEKLNEYRQKRDKEPLAGVMIGLLEEMSGNLRKAVTTLDNFAMSEPDLLITPAIKKHIKELLKHIN